MASMGSSTSSQQSWNQSQGNTFVDPSQSPFFSFLRQQAQGVAQGQMGPGGQGDVASQLAAMLGGQGQGFLSQLQGVGQGTLPGSGFLEQRLSQQNPFLNEQISQLGQDIGQQFRESILPGIRGNALAVGGLGGGRAGVAEGLAAQGAQQAFGQQAANLRFQDVGLRQAAAGQLQNAGLQQMGLQGQAASQGLSSLGGLMNLGMSPFGAQFGPLAQFAALLGPQNILSQQNSFGSSFGRSSGTNFGIS